MNTKEFCLTLVCSVTFVILLGMGTAKLINGDYQLGMVALIISGLDFFGVILNQSG